MVLPSPTSSARSQRTGSLAVARSATWSWWGRAGRAPEERSKTVGFAYFEEAQEVQPDQEILDVVEIAEREAFDERPSRSSGHSSSDAQVRPLASRTFPSSSGSATAVSSLVAMIRTGRPALRSTGISASVSAASRSFVPERGNWTRIARPSSAATRPIPSSGLKRCVR